MSRESAVGDDGAVVLDFSDEDGLVTAGGDHDGGVISGDGDRRHHVRVARERVAENGNLCHRNNTDRTVGGSSVMGEGGRRGGGDQISGGAPSGLLYIAATGGLYIDESRMICMDLIDPKPGCSSREF